MQAYKNKTNHLITKILNFAEYMFAKCKKLNIDMLPPRTFTTTIQNKIGNARKAENEKPKLAPKRQ